MPELSHSTPTEQALRESESRTRAILETAVDAIITIDERGRVESMNPAAERLFGYTPAEVVGQNVKMLMPSPYHEEHDSYLRNYLETGKKKIIGIGREVVGRRKDGSTFPMHLAVSELRLGQRRMFTGIARDITELRRTIQQLAESEARTRAILTSALDCIVAIDSGGRITAFNPAAEQTFGYSAARVIGQPMAELLIPASLREAHYRGFQYYLATGEGPILGRRLELEGLRADGSTFPVELAVIALSTGSRPEFTAYLRDITEPKRAAEQLRLYAAQVQERNAELVRSNQELDDFAYIASHDLKEPLRGIHNYSTFLIEDYADKLDDDGRAKLETLKRLTQRMDLLLDTLLQFSRVGRVDFAVEPTNLNRVLDGVLDSLRIAIEERGVEVRIPRPLPTVRCDRARTGEIFRNLIGNALKYNDKKDKWVEIAYTSGNGQPPVFQVRDNGIGIPEQHYEAIFRIFKRLHGRDRYGGGTGAGLTIVKKIVERHHGKIWLQSTPGQGTTFFFTLAPGVITLAN